MGKDQSSGRLSEASGVDRLWYPAIRTKSDMPMFAAMVTGQSEGRAILGSPFNMSLLAS